MYYHLSIFFLQIIHNKIPKETWPFKKMYISCTDPSCHNWFTNFLLVRQNSFTTAYPMNCQNKLVWQLGSVHKIHIYLEATSPLILLKVVTLHRQIIYSCIVLVLINYILYSHSSLLFCTFHFIALVLLFNSVFTKKGPEPHQLSYDQI